MVASTPPVMTTSAAPRRMSEKGGWSESTCRTVSQRSSRGTSKFETPAQRYLGKLDYNLNDQNKISLRYNVLNSSSDILISNSSSLGIGSRRSSLNSLNFATSNYAILENIRSTVAEWNSTIGSKMSNNFTVGYTSNNENRRNIAAPWFPEVEILNGGTNYTTFGFEPFTPANQLTYHSFQVQDNFNIYLPKHTLTFGFAAEQYHSKNVFFPGAQSVYVYDSLAQFYRDANAYLAQCGPYTVGQPLCSRTTCSTNIRVLKRSAQKSFPDKLWPSFQMQEHRVFPIRHML